MDQFNVNKLADGSDFHFWEAQPTYSREYHVAANHPEASDEGAGTRTQPFKTIGRAAGLLQPGEKVIIHEGVYRESVHPPRGGESAQRMISYEAAEGEKVVVKGSVVMKEGWEKSTNWNLRKGVQNNPQIWQLTFPSGLFDGYNPFGMVNLLGDYVCAWFKEPASYQGFFLRRGMIFADGQPLKQVRSFYMLGQQDNAFWVEHNGLTVHVRLKGDAAPQDHMMEVTTKEQVFSPKKHGLGYIRIKGIIFEHAGNGNPVPQRGLVSTGRGHHWVIEGCTIRWANSVGIDVGNECWNAVKPAGEYGSHVLRGNTIAHCGVCGLAGYYTHDMLMEDNMIEHIGFQRAYYAYESAGIKLHDSYNFLFRRNVVRHIEFCAGLWLDCNVVNCRFTGNVFAEMPDSYVAIQFEANREFNMVDNNIIWGIGMAYYKEAISTPDGSGWYSMDKGCYGSGILSQGSDDLIIVNNLIGEISHSGFHADVVPYRPMNGRGGTAREMKIYNNIFTGCKVAAIGFGNEHNEADGNLYIDMPAGYLRILNPDPAQWLNLETGRRFYHWDLNGAEAASSIQFDADKLELTVANQEDISAVKCYEGVTADFFGDDLPGDRMPGPFGDMGKGFLAKSVDPRKPAWRNA